MIKLTFKNPTFKTLSIVIAVTLTLLSLFFVFKPQAKAGANTATAACSTYLYTQSCQTGEKYALWDPSCPLILGGRVRAGYYVYNYLVYSNGRKTGSYIGVLEYCRGRQPPSCVNSCY